MCNDEAGNVSVEFSLKFIFIKLVRCKFMGRNLAISELAAKLDNSELSIICYYAIT